MRKLLKNGRAISIILIVVLGLLSFFIKQNRMILFNKPVFVSQNKGYNLIDDKVNIENTIAFSNQILKHSSFISKEKKSINIDSLLSGSIRFIIFFSQNDCDYCVHQLIYFTNQYLGANTAIIVPFCLNTKTLQFAQKNYLTIFDFYTTCPDSIRRDGRIYTPYIAFSTISSEINSVLPYEANDTIQLKSFIENNIKKSLLSD